MRAIGVICDKAAVRYTVVADDAAPIDVELAVPASKVKDPGASGGEKGYCAACGLAMLDAARAELDANIRLLSRD